MLITSKKNQPYKRLQSERLFAPIFEELSITDIEYCICDEAAEEAGNNRKLISFNRSEA